MEWLWGAWIPLLLAATPSQAFRSIYMACWRAGSNTRLGSRKCIQGIQNNSRDRQKYFSSHLHSHVQQNLPRRLSANASVNWETTSQCPQGAPQGSVKATRVQRKQKPQLRTFLRLMPMVLRTCLYCKTDLQFRKSCFFLQVKASDCFINIVN